jgi:CheY-like chemotaxis protein
MGGSRKIVVIDDDRNVRRLLGEAFRPPEFEIHAFARGQEALAHCEEQVPDLILSDVRMPSMGGEEILRAARASEKLKHVPFVFLSAARVEHEMSELGADGFIRKPFPLKELTSVIRRLLPDTGEESGVPEPTEPERPEAAQAVMPTGDAVTGGPSESFGSGMGPLGPLATLVEEPEGDESPWQAAGVASRWARRFPYGRFTSVRQDERIVQVLTEQSPGPNFTITTIIACGGIGLRRLETALAHPLGRNEDQQLVKRQIDFQHETVLHNLGHFIVETPRRQLLGKDDRGVSAALLFWVMDELSRRIAVQRGVQVSLELLVRTLARLSLRDESLRPFRVLADARVTYGDDAEPDLLPRATVDGVASWSLQLAAEAWDLSPGAAREKLLSIVGGRLGELRSVGYLEALSASGSGGYTTESEPPVWWLSPSQ